jgi:putative peptidoglycan lipid II flippase
MTNKKLIRSTGIIGGATVASRVLGFIRDILFARMFGTSIFAQAFVVAFRLPNMLRDMVGEGATDAAIVPTLTEYRHTRSEKEYWEAAQVILSLMLSVLLLLSALGILFAPLLVRIIAPGFLGNEKLFSLTVTLTRSVFPYIIFLGLVAYSKGILNSLNYFISPAFSPVVLNFTLILSLVLLCPLIGIKGLVAGVLAGGALELALQIRPLIRKGFRLKKRFKLFHPIAKRIFRLLLPRTLGTAVYQLSVLVDTVLASLGQIVGAGGVAALYFSNRLVQLPLAVFGISLATAALPRMSKEASLKDIEGLKRTISFSLRAVFTVMLPATAGLMILSRPIVRILFQRGEFTAYSSSITSTALFFYCFGLFAYAGIKILVSTFYSMGDTRTPVKTAAAALMVNVVLNLILMWPLGLGGLALATSVAAFSNFIMLYRTLRLRIGDIGTAGIAVSFSKVLVASAIMGTFTYFISEKVLFLSHRSGLTGVIYLVVIIGLSMAVFVITGYFLKIEGIKRIFSHVLGRIRP